MFQVGEYNKFKRSSLNESAGNKKSGAHLYLLRSSLS